MKKYNSKYYKYPIEVENIAWEILVNIITDSWKKIIYSWYNLINKTSHSPYIKNAVLLSFINNIPKNILVIWFGAWSYAKYFKDYLGKKINITWIELDKMMIEIAKKEFNLNNIDYFNLDYIEALEILNKIKNNKFNIIFFDIYNNNSQIPEDFNDIKTIKLIKNILDINWLFIINFANNQDYQDYYHNIDKKLLNIFWKNKVELLNWINDDWNIIWVYNLKKEYSSEEIIIKYLEKVQKWEINYDFNLIKNIYLK